MNPHTPPPTPPARACHLLLRLSLPFLAFSASLCALLLLSRAEFLPILTRVHVQGAVVAADALYQTEADVLSRIDAGERERRERLLPVRDPAYDALKQSKRSQVSAMDVEALLRGVSESIDAADTVVFTHVEVDAFGQARVTGDVRNAGPGSMTVLAGFIDALRGLPEIGDVVAPPFTREEDASGAFHSPFVLRFAIVAPAASASHP